MSFRGQLIKLGFQMEGATLALWQSAARFAIGGGVIAGIRLSIGSSGNEVTMTAANDRALQIYTTQSIGTGTSMTAEIDHTQTGANATIVEVLRVNLDSEVQTGSWANAIVGRINYGTAGDAGGGVAAGVCGEMNLPAKSMTGVGGIYYCFDAEMNVPSGCTLQDSTTKFAAFMKFGAWGSGNFNDYGYLFHIDGLTAATDDLLSLTSHTLKVNIGGNERFALLGSQLQDGLGLGNSNTDMALGTVATNKAVAVYTTSTATSSDVKPFFVQHTVGASGTTSNRAEFKTVCATFTMGGYSNALKGYMEFGTTGQHTGLSSGVCAELRYPSAGAHTGSYFPLEIEMVMQNGSVVQGAFGNMAGFIWCGVTQAAGTPFDEDGRFMLIKGLTGVAGSILSLTSQTLRVALNPTGTTLTERYLVLSQMENGLGLGNDSGDMDLSTVATNKAVAIYTVSSATSSDVKPFYVQHTIGAAGATCHRAEFRTINTTYQLGSYVNALKGYFDCGASGTNTGLLSGVCAEVRFPSTASAGGAYYPLEVEMVFQTSSTTDGTHGSNAGFIWLGATQASGNPFDENGYFMCIKGLTAGAGNLLSVDSQTLKINLNPSGSTWTGRYLVLSQAENILKLGAFSSTTAGDGVALDTTTYRRALEIYADDDGTYLHNTQLARLRMLITASTVGEVNALQAQLKYVNTTCGGYSGAILASFEGATAINITGGNTSAVYARVGFGSMSPAISNGCTICAVNAQSNMTQSCTGDGTTVAVLASMSSSASQVWDVGFAVQSGACTTGIHIGTCTTGINIVGANTIGFSISGTLATTTGRAIRSTVSVTNIAITDGYGINEFDVTTTGSNGATSVAAALSAWMSVNSTVGTGLYAIAQTNGIWENSGSTGDVSDSRVIFGMRATASISNTPERLCVWSLNTGATVITALYDVGIPGAEIGFTAGAGGGNQLGTVPFMVSTSGVVHYIKVWTSA